uniref:Polyketide synthase 9 n=1 Tax=Diaporthe helianthi TaxID=158607 RepID=A0A1C1WW73_DIAHE|nr:polyketide synthase 9 [Diaporthe helianthi]
MAETNMQSDAGVAICGLGLRLPGGINTPSALFDFLLAGKDARDVPDNKRYEPESFTYSDSDGKTHTLPSEGYWLDRDEITGWDPSPFSAIGLVMSQAEVEKMDPQQRILLRVVWEALESACETQWRTDKAKADRIGCYVGSFGDDWREMHGRDSLDTPKYRLAGYGDFALSNRVSNCFGFGGPSMTVRAACAAGGLALHLACQAIRAGECDTAIVAASNIILSPEFSVFLAEHGVLSPDASCRTFDANASGYARAEAVNCLIIKRQSLALRDGNPIRAIIRGSAVNANGRTAGMSTPSSEAQEALVRAAYRQAGIPDGDRAKTAMVECHGTGTPVGDAIEAYALAKMFGQHGVLIGSVKPSLGHAESASALTSIMKAILSLENRTILPNIKFETPNPQRVGLEWARIGVELLKFDRAFSDDIKAMDDALQRLPPVDRPPWSLRGEMIKTGTRSRLGDPGIAATVLTAIQVALTNLLGRYGVRPHGAAGYSTGKVAADHASGLLSIEEVICLAFYSSKAPLKNLFPASKDILSIDTLEMEAATLCWPTTLDRNLAQPLNTDPVCPSLRRHSAVDFRQEVKELLLKAPGSIHLVIGPDSSIAKDLEQAYTEAGLRPAYIPTLVRGQSATITFLTALGELYSHGVPIRLPAPNGTLKPLVDLEPYPWDLSKHYWPESRVAKSWRLREHPPHELLGIRNFDDCATSPTWRGEISVHSTPWLKDHRIGNDIVFPAAAFVAMAGEACFQLTGDKAYVVQELSLKKALVLVQGGTIEIVTSARLQPHQLSEPDTWEISFSSFCDGAWTTNCSGLVKTTTASNISRASLLNTASLKNLDGFVRQVDPPAWYKAMARIGYNYGSAFRGMQDITANATCKSAKLRLSNKSSPNSSSSTSNSYAIHPTMLDNMIQSLIVANHRGQPRLLRQLSLPTYIEEFSVTNQPLESQTYHVFPVYAVITESKGNGSCRGSIMAGSKALTTDGLATSESSPAALVTGLEFEPIVLEESGQSTHEDEAHGAMQLVWKQDIDFAEETLLLRPRAGPEHEQVQRLLGDLFAICATQVRHAALLAPAAEMRNDPNRAHFSKLVRWLQDYPHGNHRMVNRTREDMDDEKKNLLDALRNTSASAAAELLSKCSSKASEIFNGTVSPLELFLEDNALHRLYDWMNSLWSYEPFFNLLAHKYGNRLRVIEVGAGTGGLTARVLEHLNPRRDGGGSQAEWGGSYVFTDVSSGFFPSAKARFQTVGEMEYRVLDISVDPLTQGFKAEYDLVIASNVLHATPDLNKTLRHVRSLLKPNGRLLLQELACESKWMNLIMGFLPGWWLGAPDGRVQEPYIGRQAWDKRLQQASFKPLDTHVLDSHPPYHMNATMIARPEVVRLEPSHGSLDIVLLHDDVDGESLRTIHALEELLLERGFKPSRCRIGSRGPVGTKSGHVVSLLDLSPSGSFLANISQANLEWLLALLDDLENSDATPLWLTRACQVDPVDPSFAQILGFARSVRKETGLNFVTLELESTADHAMKAAAVVLESSISNSRSHRSGAGLEPDREFAYVSRAGGVVIPRFSWTSVSQSWAASQPIAETSSRQRYLQIRNPGQLDSLGWVQSSDTVLENTEPGTGMVTVRIEAAGLNFKDVLMAMGTTTKPIEGGRLGCEAAGIVTATGAAVSGVKTGDRVMLFAPDAGCLASSVVVHEHHCVPIPDSLPFKYAAGMPCVYITVLRALVDKANLQRDQTILIHSAAGGVGIAAIQVARWLGARIYATVGSNEKVEFLHREIGIPRENIFHSRDDGFVHGIMAATSGRGVDVVLNSLSGQLLHASWRCVAPCGTFVELGKRDIVGRGKLAMEPLDDNRAFVAVDMAHLAVHSTREVSRLLRQVVHLYSSGALKPVEPLRVSSYHSVAEAMRALYTGLNIGKIVIDIAGDTGGQQALSDNPDIRHKTGGPLQDATFTPENAYVLIGGLRGLSASIARWMVCHGAKRIFFLSRSMRTSPVNKQDEAVVCELRAAGCTVETMQCDVVDKDSVQTTISAIAETHRIAGVIHLAGILLDMETKDLTLHAWRTVTDPKVAGTLNLHRALTTYAPDLDFFVLASSITGITGNIGQSHYAAANSFLDAFAQYRQSLGLACSALDIGVVEDVGIMSHQPEKLETMRRTGVRLLSEQDVLDGIQLAIARSRPATPPRLAMDSNSNNTSGFSIFEHTCEAQVAVGFSSMLPLDHPNTNVLWKGDARMASYDDKKGDAWGKQQSGQMSSGTGSADALGDFISRVSKDPSELNSPSCAEFLANQIFRRVQSFLMRDEEVDSNVDTAMQDLSLASIGMDSLMTIETRNWWRQTFGTSVSLLQLTSASSFAQLGRLAARQLLDRHTTGPN